MGTVESTDIRLLVVDDDTTARYLMRQALEQDGFLVEEAADGAEALRLFKMNHHDVVLLDIVMPVMDGFSACAALRALPEGKHIPIVVITALDDHGSITRAFEAGATTFVSKPINFVILTYRMRYIVRSKMIHDRLRLSEARLAQAQRIARIGHWEWDFQAGVARCSEGLQDLFGLATTRHGISLKAFFGLVHPGDRSHVRIALRHGMRKSGNYSIEYRVIRPDGHERVIHQNTEVMADGEDGQRQAIGVCQDITERRENEARIRSLAYFDSVTGLPNRAMLHEILAQSIANARRHHRLVAVLVLDLDHFKRINDTLGHGAGDELLLAVGHRLSSCLRSSDRISRSRPPCGALEIVASPDHAVSRLGGDEFVCLLTEVRMPEDGAVAARRIAEALVDPFIVGDQEIPITASIGISIFPMDGLDAEALLKNADTALNHAKEQGRNRYAFFTSGLNERTTRRFSLATSLRKALDRGELCLHYQPQIDLFSREVIGCEALIRWQHPSVGLVSPGEFIPIAEETGLIVPIGAWVLEEACRQAAAWRHDGGAQLKVSVNVSAEQFRRPGLVHQIEEMLTRTGLAPAALGVELTESLLIEDTETSIQILQELVALGVSVSIDDFGTGYSSLNYLRQFPVRALKIDRSFVKDLDTEAGNSAIINATITLAHGLDLDVVAEGVETFEQLTLLESRSCDVVQGFLFSRPLAPDAFTTWMATWTWPEEPLTLQSA